MTPRTFVLSSPVTVDRLASFLKAQVEQHPVSVRVERHRQRRSTTANARYWAIVQKVADFTGHDPDELHDAFKVRFLGTDEIQVGAETMTVPKPSRTLDTQGFRDFMERVEAWATTTLGVFLDER